MSDNDYVRADVELTVRGEHLRLRDLTPEAAVDLITFMKGVVDDPTFTEFADRTLAMGGFGGIGNSVMSVTYSTYIPTVREDPVPMCPQRNPFGRPIDEVVKLTGHEHDYWDRVGRWRRCSYCHSMHPDDLVAALKEGETRAHWSDKRYKLYVELPGVRNAGYGPIKFYTWHLRSAKTRHALFELGVLGSPTG